MTPFLLYAEVACAGQQSMLSRSWHLSMCFQAEHVPQRPDGNFAPVVLHSPCNN